MKDIIRDSSVGQILRLITRNKILKYPEELSDFKSPRCYANSTNGEIKDDEKPSIPASSSTSGAHIPINDEESQESAADEEVDHKLEKVYTGNGLWKIPTQKELHDQEVEKTVSRPIQAKRTSDGITLVDWYTTGTYTLQS